MFFRRIIRVNVAVVTVRIIMHGRWVLLYIILKDLKNCNRFLIWRTKTFLTVANQIKKSIGSDNAKRTKVKISGEVALKFWFKKYRKRRVLHQINSSERT